MKALRFKVNFELPLRYENVVWSIYAHLKKNPSAINKSTSDKIFTKDIYQFCVDIAMDHLSLDFNKDDKSDIEIVGPNKDKDWLLDELERDPEFRKEEYRIAGTLSTKELTDYETNYQPKGLSMQEYLKLREL